MRAPTRRPDPIAPLVALLLLATLAQAEVSPDERPAALVAPALVMQNGRAFVPLADLARALGGSQRADPSGRRFEVLVGLGGVLQVNAGPLGAFAASSRSRQTALGAEGPGSEAGGGRAGASPGVAPGAFRVRIGGQELVVDEGEGALLRPGQLGVSLQFVARLLGGQARVDPTSGAWVLPRGGPASPLAFR